MSGTLTIVGLGPGSADLITPAASRALAEATDLVGYGPYLDRIPEIRPDQTVHPSDNRVELDRARLALMLAERGRRVAVVSGGDPGVFAMAAAVFEAIEKGKPAWRDLDVRVEPGITAMLAAAASVGAPLGGDFCAISLSDNLKSWATIERRLKAAAEADFVIALYNAASKARPHQLNRAFRFLADLEGRRDRDAVCPGGGNGRGQSYDNHSCGSRCRKRGHAHADHRRSEQHAAYWPGEPFAVGLHSALGGGLMEARFKPAHRLRRVVDGMKGGLMRALDHHDRKSQQARRMDFSVGCGAARIFRNHNVRAPLFQESRLGGGVERTTIVNEFDAGRKRDIAWMINHARDIAVLKGGREGRELKPSGRQKHGSRRSAKRSGRSLWARNQGPLVAILRGPGWADQAGERDARRVNGSHGVGGDARGEGMRGVHHGAGAFSLDPGGEPFPASETADPVGDGRRGRGSGPPREG